MCVCVNIGCCYSISTEPLQPSSPYYNPDSNAPPSYAISLSASSQFAVNNPGGPVYLALITFPGNYVLSVVPTGCVSVSSNTVNCTVSGKNNLVADFASVIVADRTQPRLETVVVNGEICAVRSGSCPSYTPTNPASVTPSPPASSSNPSSILPSQTPSSSSSLPRMSSSLIPSSSSALPPSPTPDPDTLEPDTPASKAMGSLHSKIGLIVGLTLAFVLLIFLACLYFLHRRRQNLQSDSSTGSRHGSGRWGGAAAAAALFQIKQKGSKLSLGCTSLQNSPNNPYPSGYDEKVLSSSNNDGPFLRAHPSLARSTSTISTTTVSEKSAAAAMGTGLGMTLIDIPEGHESESSRSSSHSTINYFQNENDEFERDLDAEFAEEPITTTNIILSKDNDEQQAPSSGPRNSWIARAASKSAQLHRAVSAASGRMLPLHSNDASRRSSQEQPLQHQHQPQHQQQSSLSRTRTGGSIIPGPRFPKDGLIFKSNLATSDRPPTRSASYASISISRPAKSIHRASFRDGNRNSGQIVVATIRPEHHHQLIQQQRLDQGLTPEQPLPSYAYHQLAAGATSAGTAANAAALSAAVAKGGPVGLYRSRSNSVCSDLDGASGADGNAFINPGPPPQPPAWGMSRSRQSSGSWSRSRRYNQPLHIRPPGPTFQPDRPQQEQQEQLQGSEGGSGLYGYM